MYKYVITLTTIPSKFQYLHLTIDSIVKQTIMPDKIIINIPKQYNFRLTGEITDEKINEFLDKYSKYNVCINKIDNDFGPATKLLGLLTHNILDKNKINDETYLIIIDDDLVYKPYFIENFDKNVNINKNIDVASYMFLGYEVGVGQAADGFFMKYNLLDSFLEYYEITKNEDYIFYHDDFYISYYFYLKKISILYMKPPHDCLIYDYHQNTFIDALCSIKGKYDRNCLYNQSFNELNKLKNENKFITIIGL
jgi:hypothetical protein